MGDPPLLTPCTSGFAVMAVLPTMIHSPGSRGYPSMGHIKHHISLDFLSEPYLYLATSDRKFGPW